MPLDKSNLKKAFTQYSSVDAFDRTQNLLTPLNSADPEFYGMNLTFSGAGTVSHLGVVGPVVIPSENLEPLRVKLGSAGAPSDVVDNHINGLLSPSVCSVVRKANPIHGTSYDVFLGRDEVAPVAAGSTTIPKGRVSLNSTTEDSIMARRGVATTFTKRCGGFTAPEPFLLRSSTSPCFFDESDRSTLGLEMNRVFKEQNGINTPTSGSAFTDPLGLISLATQYGRDFLNNFSLFEASNTSVLKGFLPFQTCATGSPSYSIKHVSTSARPVVQVVNPKLKSDLVIDSFNAWNTHYDTLTSHMSSLDALCVNFADANNVDPTYFVYEEYCYLLESMRKLHDLPVPLAQHPAGWDIIIDPLDAVKAQVGLISTRCLDSTNTGTILVILPPIPFGSTGTLLVSPVMELLGAPVLDGVNIIDLSYWSVASSESSVLTSCSTHVFGRQIDLNLSAPVSASFNARPSYSSGSLYGHICFDELNWNGDNFYNMFNGYPQVSAMQHTFVDANAARPSGMKKSSYDAGFLLGDNSMYVHEIGPNLVTSSSFLPKTVLGDYTGSQFQRLATSSHDDFASYSLKNSVASSALDGMYPSGLDFAMRNSSEFVSPRLSALVLVNSEYDSIGLLHSEWVASTPELGRYSLYSAVSGIVGAAPILSMFTLPRINGQLTLHCTDVVFDRGTYDEGGRYTIASLIVKAVDGSVSLPELVNLLSGSATDIRTVDSDIDSKLVTAETYSTDNPNSRIRFSWRANGFGLNMENAFYKTKFYKDMFNSKASPGSMTDEFLPASDGEPAVSFKQAFNRANANRNATIYALVDDVSAYNNVGFEAFPRLGSPSTIVFDLVTSIRETTSVHGEAGSGVVWLRPMNFIDGTINVELLDLFYGTTSVPVSEEAWYQLSDESLESMRDVLSEYISVGYSVNFIPSEFFTVSAEGIKMFFNRLWSDVDSTSDLLLKFPELGDFAAVTEAETTDLNPTKLIGDLWYPSFDGIEEDKAYRLHYMLKGANFSKVEKLALEYMFYCI